MFFTIGKVISPLPKNEAEYLKRISNSESNYNNKNGNERMKVKEISVKPFKKLSDSSSFKATRKTTNQAEIENHGIMKVERKLNETDLKLIKITLNNHFLFRDKTDKIINQIIENLHICQILTGHILFKEGDLGNLFYIVSNGVLEQTSDYSSPIEYKSGETFGELALVMRNNRSGMVKCKQTAELFYLDGNIFRDIIMNTNQSNLKDRIFFLSLIPIFSGLNNAQLHNIALSMLKCSFDEDQTIIQEGDVGESMFIIKEGKIKCMKGEVQVRELGIKDYFGESAILFGHKRKMTILTSIKTICFQISKFVMIENLGENYKDVLLKSIAKEAFNKSKYMKNLVFDNYFKKFYPDFEKKIHKDGDIVMTKNNYAEEKKLIVCVEGNLIYDSNNKEVVATRGELYGDKYISLKNILKYDVVASSDCISLEISWKNIVDHIGLEIEEKKILSFLSQISHMKKISILKHLSDQKLIDICKNMKKEKFSSGQVIFKENTIGDTLYLIKKGKVKIFKEGKYLREMEEGNFFGEIAVLINTPRSATTVAETDVTTYTLSKTDFFELMDKNMLEFLVKKISLQDNFNTTLEDLYFVKNLGQGKFGSVSLVHNGKNLYAIKAVNKKRAEQQKILIKYFLEERSILLTTDHPFIMKLVKTMKNDEYIFYLTEYIQGMTMSKYLENRVESNLKNKFETQFYVSILLIIVDYLNKKNICHRDIKPENIMVEEIGYLKLIDFGTAIVVKDFTSTITGTPNYIAPEILNGKGYSFSCDYWSIGIIAYEIYYNFYPFGNNATDPMEVYKDIIKKDLNFPSNNGDISVVNFLKVLLKKKVNERICDIEQLKQLEFFGDFSWSELVDFVMIAPYKPDVSLKNSPFNEETPYLEKLNITTKQTPKKESIFSNDDEKLNFNPNWADEF